MDRRSLCALAALMLVFGCREASAPAPQVEYRPGDAGTVDHALCLLGFSAVPLQEVSTGHHLVEATINGRSGSFVLDTGANATVLDQRHAGRFGLADAEGGLAGAIGLGGGSQAEQVGIDTLHVGSIPIRQGTIVIADLGRLLQMLGRVSGTTVYGIVGQDVLTEHRAIIDVARPMLYLIEEDKDPAPVPAERCQSAPNEAA